MRIFLSYASEDRSVAERIYLALVAEGHQVFFDRTGTEAGEEFNRRIRDEISRCHKFVFLISPRGVERGRYTLTELSFAQDRWLHPAQYVLPVMVSPTDLKLLPNYLKAVTILEPQGDVAAEVASKLRRRKGLWPLAGRRQAVRATVLTIVLGSGGATLMRGFFAERPIVPIKSEEIIRIPYDGFGYRYEGSEGVHLSKPDSLDRNNVSRLVLLEDGKPLGPDHSGHKDIEDVGKGRYSHWIDDKKKVYVFFSTSDNSDPRKNGRVYSVTVPDRTQPPILMDPRKILKVKEDMPTFAYRYKGPGLSLSNPNSQGRPKLSRLVVLEDSKRLGPGHSQYGEIRDIGRGRYNHWHDGQAEWLFFSTLDNSDARTNGRVYAITVDDK